MPISGPVRTAITWPQRGAWASGTVRRHKFSTTQASTLAARRYGGVSHTVNNANLAGEPLLKHMPGGQGNGYARGSHCGTYISGHLFRGQRPAHKFDLIQQEQPTPGGSINPRARARPKTFPRQKASP